jgi:uncharacterized protein
MLTAGARYPGRAPIDAYGNGGFRFAGMSHRGSILCLPDAIEAWRPERLDDVSEADLARILAAREEIDFVLIGTGQRHLLPPNGVRDLIKAAGLGLEIMATGPAARTYNILLAEKRRVATALIAVDEPDAARSAP